MLNSAHVYLNTWYNACAGKSFPISTTLYQWIVAEHHQNMVPIVWSLEAKSAILTKRRRQYPALFQHYNLFLHNGLVAESVMSAVWGWTLCTTSYRLDGIVCYHHYFAKCVNITCMLNDTLYVLVLG